MAQVVGGAESAQLPDLLHGEVRRLQQGPGPAQTLVEKPLERGGPGGRLEPPVEGTRTHRRAAGQLRDGQRPVEMGTGPVQDRGQPLVVAGGHGHIDELCLAAGPVGGHHHPAGELIRHLRTEVTAHQMQTQVQTRGQPGAGEHVAVVDVQHRGVDVHLGVALGQLAGVHPVGRGAAAVEQPRLGEREGPGAQGDHAGSRVVGAPQGRDELGRKWSALLDAGVGHRGHDDRVGAGEIVESIRRPPGEAAGRRVLPLRSSGSAQPQVVPGVGQIGLLLPEDGAGDAQFVQVPRGNLDISHDDHCDRTGTHAPKRMAGIW